MGHTELRKATRRGTELEQLRTLHMRLAREIDTCEDQRTIPALARQYRETAARIAALDVSGDEGVDDLVGNLGHVR